MKMNTIYRDTVVEVLTELIKYEIPYEVERLWDGFKVTFPWCNGDFVCHSGSYGNQEGFVETMNFPWDDGDVSMLEVNEIVVLLVRYYNLKKRVEE